MQEVEVEDSALEKIDSARGVLAREELVAFCVERALEKRAVSPTRCITEKEFFEFTIEFVEFKDELGQILEFLVNTATLAVADLTERVDRQAQLKARIGSLFGP